MTDAADTSTADTTQVTIWWADAADWGSSPGDLMALLSAPERDRFARLRRPADALAYACAHALVRLLAARELGIGPLEVGLVADLGGKPRLDGRRLPGVSLSHSGTLACAALCRTADIGIDLETSGPRTGADRLAERVLTPREVETWRANGGAWADLMAAWTVKEALLKASGVGISAGMEALQVGAPPPAAAHPLTVPEAMAPAEGWTYARITTIAATAAAVAAASPNPLTARHERILRGQCGMP